MPSYIRRIDDDSRVRRIDSENYCRSSKRQRTVNVEMFQMCGIDNNHIESINERSSASFSCSSSDEDIDASSSLQSSSDMITVEDDCEKDHETVESILRNHIKSNADTDFLKEGLGRLLERIGSKNNKAVSKQRHRLEMLNFGGHWMITDILMNLAREDTYDQMLKMDVEYCSSVSNTAGDDDERVIAVVTLCCQILQELMLTNPNNSSKLFPNEVIDKTARYQVYSAGGLDAVVLVLKRFPMSFEVQLAGCQFLSCLVSFKMPNDEDSKNKDGTTNDSTKRSNSNPTKTLINNLYQSTDGLDIIIRPLGGGVKSFLQNNTNSKKLFLSNTQIWQLYFLVADIVRSVVRQSPFDSTCRSDMIRVVEKCFFSDDSHSCNSNGDTMAVDECNGGDNSNNGHCDHSQEGGGYDRRSYNGRSNATRHVSGIGRHIYEHLMTILIDEYEFVNADALVSSMNE